MNVGKSPTMCSCRRQVLPRTSWQLVFTVKEMRILQASCHLSYVGWCEPGSSTHTVSFALRESPHHFTVGKPRLAVASGTVSKRGLSEERVCVSKSRWGGGEARVHFLWLREQASPRSMPDTARTPA